MNNNNSRDLTITKKILQEISDIEMFTENITEKDYSIDQKTQKAVVMSLINIGELAKAYTNEFISEHKEIPWRKIRSLRNVAAHKYEIIDPVIIWDTIKISIPELKNELLKI